MGHSYKVLGLMSGSSLDGIDIALCRFETDEKNDWNYTILEAETISYPQRWIETLTKLPSSSGEELIKKDISYGNYLGDVAKSFLEKYKLSADFIASHGHTIFHQPKRKFTFQLGNGQGLSTTAGLTAICDFRSKDISLGGQGAPLVPIGDELLFPEYEVCLNLGGIANISYKKNGRRMAHDVCPANQVLNFLSKQLGFDFDKDGEIARKGVINQKLLSRLNQENYYNQSAPKSLSNQYVQTNFIELINKFDDSIEHKLRTCTEHIVQQICKDTNVLPKGKLLATGGGTLNSFLIDRLQKASKHTILVPDKKLVNFKEAMVFGFMGVLRIRNKINCYATVTGASKDSSCGVIYYP